MVVGLIEPKNFAARRQKDGKHVAVRLNLPGGLAHPPDDFTFRSALPSGHVISVARSVGAQGFVWRVSSYSQNLASRTLGVSGLEISPSIYHESDRRAEL